MPPCVRPRHGKQDVTDTIINLREYPVADDRGGIPEDFDNYVTLLKRLRSRFNASGRPYGISITLASDFRYRRTRLTVRSLRPTGT